MGSLFRAIHQRSSSRVLNQSLEPRLYLKIPVPPPTPGVEVEIVNPSEQIIVVIGTEGNDIIAAGRDEDNFYEIFVNSLADRRRFPIEQIAGVRYYLFGGDDVLVIQKDVTVPVTVFGGDGEDRIITSAGDDRLEGGAGNDSIYGQDGNDRLYGDGGADRLVGGNGRDFIYGGSGRDRSDRDPRDRVRESIELFM